MCDRVIDSPLAKPLPRSPKIAKLRENFKKSPLRSPLRDVLKQRCAQRIKNSRSQLLDSLRGIQSVQEEIKIIVKDEAAAFRGGRRSLSFGLTDEDVDEALSDLQSIEVELLEVAEILSDSDLGVVCPICQRSALSEEAKVWIVCKENCGRILRITGGLPEAEKQLTVVVEAHSKECDWSPNWASDSGCVMAFCDKCDFCSALGGV